MSNAKLARSPRPAPLYLNIRTLHHLAFRLGIPLHVLEQVAEHVVWHYNRPSLREKKGGGAPRQIDAPMFRLKNIQRQINRNLLGELSLPEAVHAYRRGRSVKSAAQPHTGRPFLWVADIRHFYPSISHRRVYAIFMQLGCTPNVSRLLTQLTTYGFRLPQGAPTSPTLANLYLRMSRVVIRLEGLANRRQLDVTLFGDDILVSGDRPFHGLTQHFGRIVRSSGLKLHATKTLAVAGPGEPHRALGIVMDSGGTDLDVPRTYRRKLRALIAICRRYGPTALREFGITTADPRAYLKGKIAFAIYINHRNAVLLERFNQIRW